MRTERDARTATPGAIGVALFLFLFGAVLSASAAGFGPGDILVALTNGTVQVRAADGTLKSTLSSPDQGQAKGLVLDSQGNLLVSQWWSPTLTSGNTVLKYRPDGSFAGVFGSGYNCNPSGIVMDSHGNIFVGEADCQGDILKFDSAGQLVARFNAAIDQRGARWLDLAADNCTMYYTSAGPNVSRFNVCTGVQLPNFTSTPLVLPDGAGALGLRSAPDGGVIVATLVDVRRLDASGNQVAIYDAVGENGFSSIFLDADGKSFWTSSFLTSNVYKFDIATGQILMSFNSGVADVGAKGVLVIPAAVTPPPESLSGRMTGGGNFRASDGTVAHHGFQLRCDAEDRRQNLEINWGKGQNFHLTAVASVSCYDDPKLDPEHPAASIDTLVLTGTGRFNNKDGATITLVFTDAGEPGFNDGVQMVIRDAQGKVVLDVSSTTLIGGNHQAHKSK